MRRRFEPPLFFAPVGLCTGGLRRGDCLRRQPTSGARSQPAAPAAGKPSGGGESSPPAPAGGGGPAGAPRRGRSPRRGGGEEAPDVGDGGTRARTPGPPKRRPRRAKRPPQGGKGGGSGTDQHRQSSQATAPKGANPRRHDAEGTPRRSAANPQPTGRASQAGRAALPDARAGGGRCGRQGAARPATPRAPQGGQHNTGKGDRNLKERGRAARRACTEAAFQASEGAPRQVLPPERAPKHGNGRGCGWARQQPEVL